MPAHLGVQGRSLLAVKGVKLLMRTQPVSNVPHSLPLLWPSVHEASVHEAGVP